MSAATIALLIRHAETNAIGNRLVGRLPGVHLNARGLESAGKLAQLPAIVQLDAIYSSPLERARETAASLSQAGRLPVQIDDDITEVDFGEWTGLTFDALHTRADWRRFNEVRSQAEVPGGERATRVQERIMSALRRMAARHLGRTFALVSHADVIRAAVLHVSGVSLDAFDSLQVEPGSITAVSLDPPARVLAVNMDVAQFSGRV